MSATAAPTVKMSPTEFLAWERAQPGRHQYVGGQVFAMAGGSPRHNLLAARILARLDVSGGSGCHPFSSDQKISVPATGDYVYADATVVCGPVVLQKDTTDVIENPRVVVEVLSKSTEHHDRGDKWQDYRAIETLTDYVLVSQRIPRLEHFRRDADGSWRYRAVSPGGRLELSTGILLAVDDLYAGTFDVPGDD